MASKFNQALFSHKLRDKQYQLRLNVTAAAKEIGVSKSTLSRLNRDAGLPDVDSYFMCCKWLDIDMNFFFN